MQEESMTKALSAEAPIISILWDAAPLWGHLVLNSVIQTGLSYALIRSKDCIKNGIQSKILIVPGGSGRLKASKLGAQGILAIRNFIENGGAYIGFCGGAGLALSDGDSGLGICPWSRNLHRDRIQHLVSGHIISSLNQDVLIPERINHAPCTEAALPVWWPGRFQEPTSDIILDELQSAVRVLARYKEMGNDLHVADLPIQKLPPSALEDCQNLYGINLRPHLLDGQPAIITGSFGSGQYILSYSHLETPDSPAANALFAHMLRTCLKGLDSHFSSATSTGFEARGNGLVKNILNVEAYSPTWLNPDYKTTWPILRELYGELEGLFKLGVDLHLLFPRTEWLYGWHSSVPGSHLNALRVALLRSLLLPPSEEREHYLMTEGVHFAQNMLIFVNGAKSWLLARRLSETMVEADIIPRPILHAQREELFGLHMAGGGLCGSLIDWLDEFLFL